MRISEFRQKEVIDTDSGERLGFVQDVEFSAEEGRISGILLPGTGKFFGLFGGEPFFIPWESIKKIGDDIVLVKSFPTKKELP